MPILTRRRYPQRPDCWHIYYGDVCVGAIARRVGNPFDTDPGNGVADSIPAVSPASARATPPKRSTRPVATSKRHGWCFYRSEPRPTFRNGAISGIARGPRIIGLAGPSPRLISYRLFVDMSTCVTVSMAGLASASVRASPATVLQPLCQPLRLVQAVSAGSDAT